jgi:hypothetical protein
LKHQKLPKHCIPVVNPDGNTAFSFSLRKYYRGFKTNKFINNKKDFQHVVLNTGNYQLIIYDKKKI